MARQRALGHGDESRRIRLSRLKEASLIIPEDQMAKHGNVRAINSQAVPNSDENATDVLHRKATVNAINLYYLQAGSGPAVVLLHGWANTAHAWRHVIRGLRDRYTLIAPDLRGMGNSSRPLTGYDRETVANDIRALLDQLGIERADIVGHDLGAHVAFELASRSPERVSRLVMLDGVVPGLAPWSELRRDPRLWHWSFYNVPDLPEALMAGRERVYLSWFIKAFAVNIDAVEEDMEAVIRDYSEPGAIRGGLGMFRTIDSDAGRNARWCTTNRLAMPVLALGGSKGVGSALIEQMQAVGDDVRGGVIADCGHWIATECPQTLIAQMTAFFDEESS
jgi:pimeloyl-ACP methyl ester carboxylesterase